jgi:hypothetical protein
MARHQKNCVTAALLAMSGACASLPAEAYPEGAPWGASDPAAAENCASCHFDYEPVSASAALSLEGLPRTAEPGATYRITVRFDAPDAVIAGFQMIAKAADDAAGEFASTQTDIEYLGAAIRSTAPSANDGTIEWTLTWTAPDVAGGSVTLFLAAMRANDDGSPFGDQAHFRSYVVSL